MSDISATQQRLSLALDRIDQGIGRLHQSMRAGDGAPEQGVADQKLQKRLVEAGAESARLAAANDQLIAANRALIEAADPAALLDAAFAAQSAEIEALRAAREAELAQLGDVLAMLESMLGMAGEDQVAAFDEDLSPVQPEGQIVRFGAADTGDEQEGKG